MNKIKFEQIDGKVLLKKGSKILFPNGFEPNEDNTIRPSTYEHILLNDVLIDTERGE